MLLLAVLASSPSSWAGAAAAQPVPSGRTATIADRYALAERFLRQNMAALTVDAGMDQHFSDDGRSILYRRDAAGDAAYLRVDPQTLRVERIATRAQLATALAAAVGHPVDAVSLRPYRTDYDAAARRLAFSWNGARWTLEADGRVAAAREPTPVDGLSPDGRYRIVARAFNLVAIEVATGREVPLTTDGTREQPYGRGIATLPDILAQGSETPTLPVSLRWSPDSRFIATWRLDTRDVAPLSITQQNPPGGALVPRSFRYIYPLAGAARLPQATRLAIDVADAFRRGQARIVPLAIPAESLLYPADPDYGWDGDGLRVQWTERGYGQVVVYRADPATGAARVVARERVKPVVTVTSGSFQPANDLGGELDISERSGWAQLYLVKPADPDGGQPLTRGDWEVLSVEHVDAARRRILLTGVGREAGRDPYFRALYRIGLNGAAPVLLTPEPLDHDVTVSPDGRWVLDAMSSPTVPTRTVLRDTETGRIALELGHADAAPLATAGFTPPEPFVGVAADGRTPLHAMIFRPAHFDPGRSYPVIDNVYTGPTTTNVPTGWRETVTDSANSVAQLGAVVVQIDARGTSRRGQAFRLPAFRNLGEVGLDDHIAMIRQIAARYRYVDVTRAGVYGCSAGGYDAARFILRRPGFFRVAVASSGNHDLRLDKAWWPEVSMGDPAPAVWDRNSNMSVAGNLVGKLLLTHGDIDDNVPVTETYRLQQAILDAGRTVDVVILPNANHCEFTPEYWRKFRDYFTRNLLGEAPPTAAQTASTATTDPLP